MKQAENNEIDTLLRNLARSAGSASTAQEFAGAHLDVDELSSYAERVLPPSARARCTAHLADCDDCREIVGQLSLAAGPLPEEKKSEQGAAARLTLVQRLSVFLSPQVLRYAMPALVLVVVAVAFFGWRQQKLARSSEYIALNQRAASAPAATPVGASNSASDRADVARDKSERKKTSEAEDKPEPAAPSARDKEAKAPEGSSEEKKASRGASGSTATAEARKQDADSDTVAVAQPSYAPERPAPPPPATKAAAANNDESPKDLAKNNVSEDRGRARDINVARKGPARNESEVVSQRGPAKREAQSGEKAKTAPSAGARAAGEDDETETRTVAGRHFHRVKSAWVDTAYKSAMPITSVARGSEQYRALIADEPIIGSIARQLSGEVIVVWKSHAYRIN